MEDGTKFLFRERMHNSVDILKSLKYTFQWGEHYGVELYLNKAIFLIKGIPKIALQDFLKYSTCDLL